MSVSSAAQPAFNPADFVKGQPVDNPYLPYKQGTTFVYDSFSGDVLEQVDTQTVTGATRRIDGVTCTIVLDVVADAKTGQVLETTNDYYAQDKSGNVWYFGEAGKEFDNGKLVAQDRWRAGVHGASPGIIMEAHPKVGDSYDQEIAPGVAQDHAEVISVTGSATVPFGTFNNLVVTHEDSTLEPTASETKSFAAGVGQVSGNDLQTGLQDRLVSVTTDANSKLVQALAGFGASAGGLDSGLSAVAANDSGLHHILTAAVHHG